MITQYSAILYDECFGPMHERVSDHGAFGLVTGILWLLILVTVVIVVYKLISDHDHTVRYRDPIDIAKERFAKGEISKTELAEIKKELKS